MRLAIILATVGICGLGYAMYSSVKQTYGSAGKLHRIEGEIGNMLDELVDHLHTYTQYYERRVWERHTAIKMTEECMALPQGDERDLLRVQMGQYVKKYNGFKNDMAPFCRQELEKAGGIALELKNKQLLNPEQAALFSKCWEEMVPYALSEGYFHPTLPSKEKHRKQILEETHTKIIKRKQEYAETHKQRLQWEQDYAYIKSEDIMARAELATAKQDMEEADHALALLLAENSAQEEINKASALVAEQVVLYQEAALKANEVEMAMIQLETAKFDMQPANNDNLVMNPQQAAQELNSNPTRGVRIVPGTDHNPPPAGGGWGSEFVQGIWSGIF